MTKEQAEQRARTFKRGAFFAAAISFVVLWQAAAHHLTGVTSRSTSATSQQQGNQGFVPSAPSQGYGFGSATSSQPITQTSVS